MVNINRNEFPNINLYAKLEYYNPTGSIKDRVASYIINKLFKENRINNETDQNGGYLLNRIERVNMLINEMGNVYWVNQYENPLNAEAYYTSLGG